MMVYFAGIAHRLRRKIPIVPVLALAAGLALTACTAPGSTASTQEQSEATSTTSAGAVADQTPAEPDTVVTPESPDQGAPEVRKEEGTPTVIADERPPRGAESEFRTDFSLHSVPYRQIISGGPGKDDIPAIDDPQYVSVGEANEWLLPQEPVVQVMAEEQARAYPLQILTWHEIVNDTLGGKPLLVTFCPLCNTAIAFEREREGQIFDFGTTGRLRYSNLIMYDRQTETWWQQANGEAIAGELTGERLDFYPASIVSWEDFRTAHSDGSVLSRETGHSRPYGRNPYSGYDDVNNPPFLYDGPQTPGILRPMDRVLTMSHSEDAAAYPYYVLEEEIVVNDEVGGTPVAVFWAEGTASALDAGIIAEGRDVGSAVAYFRTLGDQTLTFSWDGASIRDKETDSTWNLLGEAVDGPLAGERLQPIPDAVNHFWFSWAAFRPDTRVYEGSDTSQ